MEDLRNAIKKHRLYDYIAENYYKLTKEQLKELILNLDYVATEGICDSPAADDFYDKLDSELADRDFWEE